MKRLWSLATCFLLVVLGFRVLMDTLWAAWPVLLVLVFLISLFYLAIFRRFP